MDGVDSTLVDDLERHCTIVKGRCITSFKLLGPMPARIKNLLCWKSNMDIHEMPPLGSVSSRKLKDPIVLTTTGERIPSIRCSGVSFNMCCIKGVIISLLHVLNVRKLDLVFRISHHIIGVASNLNNLTGSHFLDWFFFHLLLFLLLPFSKVQKCSCANDHKRRQAEHTDKEDHESQGNTVEEDQSQNNVHEDLRYEEDKNGLDVAVRASMAEEPSGHHK